MRDRDRNQRPRPACPPRPAPTGRRAWRGTRASTNAAATRSPATTRSAAARWCHGWPMKVGASVHSSHRGDQYSSSADVPSRALLISRPSCDTASVMRDADADPQQQMLRGAARRSHRRGAKRRGDRQHQQRQAGRDRPAGRRRAAPPDAECADGGQQREEDHGDLHRLAPQFAARSPHVPQAGGGEDVDGRDVPATRIPDRTASRARLRGD